MGGWGREAESWPNSSNAIEYSKFYTSLLSPASSLLLMLQPPVRELLANFLRQRHDTILVRLLAQIEASPDLAEIHELAQTNEFQVAVVALLSLLADNIANVADERCFNFVRRREASGAPPRVHVSHMLRLASLYRQLQSEMLAQHFAEDSSLLQRMNELLETQSAKFERAFTEAYQAAHDHQSSASETKYFSLFENASEAIISFRPGAGRIIEVNAQAERLMGKSRNELFSLTFPELFDPAHREQADWLITQPGGSSNIRLEEMTLRRNDGLNVPISLSCNWVNIEGAPVAQVIMRDVTQVRQMQRELQNYAEQLEDRVASRTRELSQSEDRYRTLFLQEQSRAQHLALINDVQQCALATRDVNDFLHQVTRAIQSHFRHCDVSVLLFRETPLALLGSAASPYSSPHSSAHRVLGAALPAEKSALMEGSALAETTDSAAYDKTEELLVARCDYLVVVAQTGGHGLASPPGALARVEKGTPLFHAFYKGALHFQNDASLRRSSTRFPGALRDTGAEIYVPIKIESRTIGVLQVQSERANSFDPRDAVALQTASLIVSSHIQSSRMFHEMSELKEFNETVIGTMSHSLMVVGGEGEIELVNERLLQTWHQTRDALLGRRIIDVLGEQICEKHDLRQVLLDVTRDGLAREIPEVRVWVRTDETRETEQVFDMRLSRVYFRGRARVVVLLINLTQRWRKTQQLQLMNEMGRLFQASLDINRVLHTVLTCVTAGPALGFNRAFLLLFDEDNATLRGVMALGPSSAEEASQIWSEMGRRDLSLQEILADETAFDALNPTPLQQKTLEVSFDLHQSCVRPLIRSVYERRALKTTCFDLTKTDENCPLPPGLSALMDLLIAPETAIAPLVAKERVVGVVLADNLYSMAPIEEDDLRLLDTVAQQAGLTVDNALTYQDLQKAQKDLVAAERLGAVGEMAARVSHEIRNPLATIGGFARSILRRADDIDDVQKKTGIIVEEVERLEELLSDLLDMARPRELDLQLHNINDIVDHALLLAGADVKAFNVEVKKELQPDLPSVLVDRRRLLQALLNTMRNGAQAMPNGGMMFVATRISQKSENSPPMLEIEVRDTGVGIPERALKQIFDPFFSTKIRGSGLGLAVTLRIIRDHGGDIDVFSGPNEGTVFVISLPLRLVHESQAIEGQTHESQEIEDAT